MLSPKRPLASTSFLTSKRRAFSHTAGSAASTQDLQTQEGTVDAE